MAFTGQQSGFELSVRPRSELMAQSRFLSVSLSICLSACLPYYWLSFRRRNLNLFTDFTAIQGNAIFGLALYIRLREMLVSFAFMNHLSYEMLIKSYGKTRFRMTTIAAELTKDWLSQQINDIRRYNAFIALVL